MKVTLVLATFLVFLQSTTSCETACGRAGNLHPCQPGETRDLSLQAVPHTLQNLASKTLASLDHLGSAITL